MAAQSRDSNVCPYCSYLSQADVHVHACDEDSECAPPGPGPRNDGCRLCRVQRLSQSTLQMAKNRQIASVFQHSPDPMSMVGLDNPLPEPVIATDFEEAFDSFRQFMSFASKQCGRYHGHCVSQHPHRYDNGGRQVIEEDALSHSRLAENAVKCPLATQQAPLAATQSKARTKHRHISKPTSQTYRSSASPAAASAPHPSQGRPAVQGANAKRSAVTEACSTTLHYNQYHCQRQASIGHRGNPLQTAGTGNAEGGVHVQVDPGTYVVTAARWGQQGRRHDTHIVNLEKEQCVQLTFSL